MTRDDKMREAEREIIDEAAALARMSDSNPGCFPNPHRVIMAARALRALQQPSSALAVVQRIKAWLNNKALPRGWKDLDELLDQIERAALAAEKE